MGLPVQLAHQRNVRLNEGGVDEISEKLLAQLFDLLKILRKR